MWFKKNNFSRQFCHLKKLKLVNSQTVFFSTIIVAAMIMLLVYLTGLGNHRSLYRNSLITTTILLIVFFCFIAIGLYRGWKLKDTMGNFWNHFSKLKNQNGIMTFRAIQD
jgi:magnesium-transporting ATPase (P-type)